MNYKEYQLKALETAMFPAEQGMAYTALGLVGEIGELADLLNTHLQYPIPTASIVKELGDVCWYLSVFAHTAQIEVDGIAPDFFVLSGGTDDDAMLWLLVNESAAIANNVKKVIRDGAASPLPKDAIAARLAGMWYAASHIATNHHVTMDEVLRINIEKLASRKARGVIQGSGDHR